MDTVPVNLRLVVNVSFAEDDLGENVAVIVGSSSIRDEPADCKYFT